jgi:hypothetical protein
MLFLFALRIWNRESCFTSLFAPPNLVEFGTSVEMEAFNHLNAARYADVFRFGEVQVQLKANPAHHLG